MVWRGWRKCREVPLDCKSFTFTSSSGDRVYARDLADASAHGIASDEQMVEDVGEEQELLAESARSLIAAAKAYRNENRLQKELDQFLCAAATRRCGR